MMIRTTLRTGRAAIAAAAVAMAGCSADPPLSPTAPGDARMSRQEAAGGESRASIYVIGSGRSKHDGE